MLPVSITDTGGSRGRTRREESAGTGLPVKTALRRAVLGRENVHKQVDLLAPEDRAGLHRSAEPGSARRSHTAGSACAQEEGGSWGKHGFPHATPLPLWGEACPDPIAPPFAAKGGHGSDFHPKPASRTSPARCDRRLRPMESWKAAGSLSVVGNRVLGEPRLGNALLRPRQPRLDHRVAQLLPTEPLQVADAREYRGVAV